MLKRFTEPKSINCKECDMLDKATSYEDLVRRLKEGYCPKCELNLFCASGRSGGASFWCNNCSGYYVPDLMRIVHCSGFPARHGQYRWEEMKGSSFVRATCVYNGHRDCPACTGKEPPKESIHGFVAEEHR